MKKVGIITLNGYKNYGNRLQNYALEQIIISLGYEVETIVLIPISSSSKMSIKNKIQSIKSKESANTILVIIKVLYLKLINIIIRTRIENKREKLFKDFSDKYLNESEPILATEKNLEKLNKKYDKFVVGSDQVWNPNIRNDLRNEYFLTFADRSKRIAYAASFGVSELTPAQKKIYSKALSKFSYISVRETQGIEILKELLINDSIVTLDPTLIFDKSFWDSIVTRENIASRKFLLVNLLGNKTSMQKSTIKKIASRDNLKVIDISKWYINFYTISPETFIKLITRSSYIITDSFHTSVFSYIYNKKFLVFSRGLMNSRIENLYEIIYQDSLNGFDTLNFESYPNANKNDLLINMRNKSLEYLKKSLK